MFIRLTHLVVFSYLSHFLFTLYTAFNSLENIFLSDLRRKYENSFLSAGILIM